MDDNDVAFELVEVEENCEYKPLNTRKTKITIAMIVKKFILGAPVFRPSFLAPFGGFVLF
jgi:hypothetical protein